VVGWYGRVESRGRDRLSVHCGYVLDDGMEIEGEQRMCSAGHGR
jgi:hypothetical protein